MQDMAAAIVQRTRTQATSHRRARWRVRDDEKVATPSGAHGTKPVAYRAAVRSRLALDLDRDLGLADDEHDFLARETAERGAGRG